MPPKAPPVDPTVRAARATALAAAQAGVSAAEQARRNAAVVRRGAIKAARDSGMTLNDIAAVLGISRPAVIAAIS